MKDPEYIKDFVSRLLEGTKPAKGAPMDEPPEDPPEKKGKQAYMARYNALFDRHREEEAKLGYKLNKGKPLPHLSKLRKNLPEDTTVVNSACGSDGNSTPIAGISKGDVKGANLLGRVKGILRRKKPAGTIAEAKETEAEKKRKKAKASHRTASPRAGWRNKGIKYKE